MPIFEEINGYTITDLNNFVDHSKYGLRFAFFAVPRPPQNVPVENARFFCIEVYDVDDSVQIVNPRGTTDVYVRNLSPLGWTAWRQM